MKTAIYDALIVGGGPAGAAAAVTLHRKGLHVGLVDQSLPGQFKVGEGLIPAAGRILRELGAQEDWWVGTHVQSMGNASAWGSADPMANGLATFDFLRSVDGPGWHLDRAAFDLGLRTLAASAGVEVLAGTRLFAFARGTDRWFVTLEQGGKRREVEARWLLDATGRPHTVARRLGIKRLFRDRLLGFYLLFRAGQAGDADSLSLVESAEEGWWYSALLPDGRRIVILFTDTGSAAAVNAQSLEGYLRMLLRTEHVADRLANFYYVPEGLPQSTDARSGRLPAVHGEGWMALGDAAMAFDPLSSQGIYTALYAGLKAGHALSDLLGGNAAAMGVYAQQLDAVWEAYVVHWKTYYAAEQRWVDAPFWKKRR